MIHHPTIKSELVNKVLAREIFSSVQKDIQGVLNVALRGIYIPLLVYLRTGVVWHAGPSPLLGQQGAHALHCSYDSFL